MFKWRSFLLRVFGARIGRDVHIYPSVEICIPWNLSIGNESCIGENALIYNLGLVKIGDQVTVSHRAHLCAGTHDYSNPTLPLLRQPTTIESQAWVCADAFVGPNVTIAKGAIVGAGCVIVKDVPAWAIFAGNPARFIKTRQIRESMREPVLPI